jgi:fructose-bisphosphate aldolase class 1
VLKPNMVIAGKKAKNRADVDEVAEKTKACSKPACPPLSPASVSSPAGQSDATAGRRCGSWRNQ